MTDKTFLGSPALDVAVDTEAHIDFVHRHYPIHCLNRSVTLLAGDSCPNMGFMDETDEIRQHIDPVPANFERRLMIVRPRLRNRFDTAKQRAAVAADAALDRRYAGRLRATRVLVTVLARDFIDARVHAMTERYRLFDVRAWRPRPLRERRHRDATDKQE